MFNDLSQVPNVTHQQIEVNGIKLHVAFAGKGEPILLIHGWPQHWYVWRKIIPLLNNYQLIMPDLPGLGWSDLPKNNDFRKEKLAEIMIGLLENLKVKQTILVGHDWGGWIGFLMCLKKPEMFSNFLALAVNHPFKNNISVFDYRRFLYQLLIAMPILGEVLLVSFPSFTEWLVKKCIYNKNTWTEKELRFFSEMLQHESVAYTSSQLYRTFLIKEFLPILFGKYKNKKLLVPATLLIGENDPVINPSLFKNFKNPTNNITLEIIKNCGHFIPEEHPETVVKSIKALK